MRSANRMICAILTILIVGSLMGCVQLSSEEKAAKAAFRKSAENYYKEKYGNAPDITEYGYDIQISLFPYNTGNLFAQCSDGTVIYYDAQKDVMADNKQSDAVSGALEIAFQDRIAMLEKKMQNGKFIVNDLDFSACEASDYEGSSFYTACYNGDTDAFIQEEDIGLSAEIFLICDREDAWEDTAAALEKIVASDFRGSEDVQLTVLSSDCYETYLAGDYRYPGTDMLECYAVYQITAQETKRYIQNYIKLADGIYATSDKANVVFEEGDLTLVACDVTEEEINQVLFENYDALPQNAEENINGVYYVDDKAHVDYWVVTADTPIYRLRFSERIRELGLEEIPVYLRFVPEELGISEEARFYTFINDGDVHYRCYSVYTGLADAEFEPLNEQDYYFGGTQRKQVAGAEQPETMDNAE